MFTASSNERYDLASGEIFHSTQGTSEHSAYTGGETDARQTHQMRQHYDLSRVDGPSKEVWRELRDKGVLPRALQIKAEVSHPDRIAFICAVREKLLHTWRAIEENRGNDLVCASS